MARLKSLMLYVSVLSLVAMLLSCAGTSNKAGPTPEGTVPHTHSPTATPASVKIPMVDTSRHYTATIRTEKGDLVLELFASDAPITVSNFIYLARQGFYDGTTFHRVIPGFMAQGGDPTGTGTGGPGYFIPDEISERTHVTGALSMANAGFPDTGGSQFFITYKPQHYLDGIYTVFGQLIKGMDVLESLTPRDPAQNPDYEGDSVITIIIEES